jgi:hypothetical protein
LTSLKVANLYVVGHAAHRGGVPPDGNPGLNLRSTPKKAVTLAVVALAAAVLAGSMPAVAARRRPPHFEFGRSELLNSHAPLGNITNAFGTPGVDRNGDVATDGAGHWLAVWHATGVVPGEPRDDWDILVSRSMDDGKTWTTPVPLNNNAATDTGDDLEPVVVTDESGVWLAAWASTESMHGSLGLDNDILFARSVDNGETWSNPAPLNVNAGDDYGDDRSVRIATDGAGAWVALWSSTDSLTNRIGGDSDILTARSNDKGATWTQPIPLNTNAAHDASFDKTPDIVTDGAGRWLAAWSSGDPQRGKLDVDRDILVAHSEDGGATWSDPYPLNTNAGDDDNADWTPCVATDGRGLWLAVWTSADSLGDTVGADRDVVMAVSKDNGLHWTPPKPIDPNASIDAREDSSPTIVTNGLGGWFVAWHSWSTFNVKSHVDADILITYSDDGGEVWTRPVPINADAADDEDDDVLPEIATDAAGHVVALWVSFDASSVRTSGPAWDVSAAAGRILDSSESGKAGHAAAGAAKRTSRTRSEAGRAKASD